MIRPVKKFIDSISDFINSDVKLTEDDIVNILKKEFIDEFSKMKKREKILLKTVKYYADKKSWKQGSYSRHIINKEDLYYENGNYLVKFAGKNAKDALSSLEY